MKKYVLMRKIILKKKRDLKILKELFKEYGLINCTDLISNKDNKFIISDYNYLMLEKDEDFNQILKEEQRKLYLDDRKLLFKFIQDI